MIYFKKLIYLIEQKNRFADGVSMDRRRVAGLSQQVVRWIPCKLEIGP
jgi:hypothetical protein